MKKRVLEKMKEIKMWKFSVDRHALQGKARDDGNLFFQQDSRSCGGAVVVLHKFWGRARLMVCGCPKICVINRIAYPRPNL